MENNMCKTLDNIVSKIKAKLCDKKTTAPEQKPSDKS